MEGIEVEWGQLRLVFLSPFPANRILFGYDFRTAREFSPGSESRAAYPPDRTVTLAAGARFAA